MPWRKNATMRGMTARLYTDDQLAKAVAASGSWRGVLRELGLAATSSAAIRSVRRNAQRLGLDISHFTGQRRWTEAQLEEAIAASRSWTQVAETLGLSGGSSTTLLKGHAVRLGLDSTHFGRGRPDRSGVDPAQPAAVNLPRAGSFLAAAWFALSGYDVSWPLEPCAYDLLVHRDRFSRVQVKTTRVRANETWIVRLHSGGRQRGPYDPDDIDYFFVIDGDLEYYLIPVPQVGGLNAIHVAAYSEYRLAKQLIAPEPSSATP